MAAEPWLDEGVLPALPRWLSGLVSALSSLKAEDLSLFLPPDEGGRRGAVLILFGEGPQGPDVLLIERAADLRSHAGQPAFPGGAVDDTDADAIAAALREADEETGLDPRGVTVWGTLPDLFLPPSGFVVTPVLAWWSTPSAVAPGDPGEVAAVHRVPLSVLLDPANRVEVRHPIGYIGPGFDTHGMIVWGFTGMLLSRLFDIAGWTVPWTPQRTVQVEDLLLEQID